MDLVLQARTFAGLTQSEMARLADTSRTTLSAYEHGRKSPTLATAQRLVGVAGYELTLRPRLEFATHAASHGHVFHVPNQPPRLPLHQAFATVVLPLHLNWSEPKRVFDMSKRSQRGRVYEIVLREGVPEDILAYVDGVLLVDLWFDLVLPRDLRAAWAPVLGMGPA